MKFDSPSKNKPRRKSTAEPTMTIHTRAATDEIYDIFNQPLKAESGPGDDCSDFEDDDYTSVGDSTVGHLSAASSDFGDDETQTFHKSHDEEGYDDMTQGESVAGSEWTQFTARDIPEGSPVEEGIDDDTISSEPAHRHSRFIPEMPEDYVPPIGTYRDPEVMAQNRLPFMTPIVEQTEHSLASMTAARSAIYNAKTPSKPMLGNQDLLPPSPLPTESPDKGDITGLADEIALSPTAKKVLSSPRVTIPFPKQTRQPEPIIQDAQCNPTDDEIRRTIIKSLDPPLTSYSGYYAHAQESNYAVEIHKYMKAFNRRARSGGETALEIPILEFPDAERSYIIRRALGEGAYAPVYLSESVQNQESDSEIDAENRQKRYGFEAIKLEVGPPSAWEFYMIRTAHKRINQAQELSRAATSIIRAHELHVFNEESFLIEDYCGQGTLLDLVNIVRKDALATNPSFEGGLDDALAMFFTIELFRTVEALHANDILHGDIKADNCLIRFDGDPIPTPAPSSSLIDLDENDTGEVDDSPEAKETHYSPSGSKGWSNKGLSLIDFGRSIDMCAFKPIVQFTADWDPSPHECNEIREMRPWTHQIDLYGIAGVIHVMLFGKYLESSAVRKSEDNGDVPNGRTYRIRETLKRYWERDLWADVFDLLLNPGKDRWVDMELGGQDENRGNNGPVLPVLKSMRHLRERMESWLAANAERKGLAAQIRKLEVIFSKRKLEKR